MATKKSAAPKKKIKKGNITYTKVSCHTTEAAAKAAADRLRAQGFTATISGGCAFKGRRRKKAKKAKK